MHWLWLSLHHAALMGWETFWALVLGFAVSAALQVFVSKQQMGRLFGQTNLRAMALATGFGAASSSCSYAAAAAGRSALARGAALIPALAFMFASTNLVIELGAVLWLLMGWRFVLAEVVGSFVLIGLVWTLGRLLFPRGLEEDARQHAQETTGNTGDGGCCHGEHDHHDHGGDGDGEAVGGSRWQRLGNAFVMDWQMLWKEIAVGFLISGFLSTLVPDGWWKALFLEHGPGWLRVVENAVVGPLIAMASFVCSVGNLPLANLLWSDGISFGGVISFIYADLLIVPLLLAYRKYFGVRGGFYVALVLFLSTVGAGIAVDLLFTVGGLVPTGPRPPSALHHMHFQWNYTTWLDLLALPVAGWLWWLSRRPSAGPPISSATAEHAGHHAHHHGG